MLNLFQNFTLMSERKKIKVQKGTEECKKLLEMLKSINKKTEDDDNSGEKIDIQQAVSFVMENLKSKETRGISIQILAELCRIAFKDVEIKLKQQRTLEFCFNTLLEILKTEIIDLSIFISSGLPSLMNDEDILYKYLEFYPKSQMNRTVIIDILAMFIESSSQKNMIIDDVLSKYQKYKDLVPRIAKLIDFDKLQEDIYIDLFLNCNYVREFVELKVVKGKKRYLYVEKLVDVNLDFALENYIRDRDVKIRLLLVKMMVLSLDKYINEPCFNLLLNDSDENVRSTLINSLNWQLGLDLVADRVLDKSSKVRFATFELYKKGLLFVKAFPKHNIFDEDSHNQNVFNGKLNFGNEITASLKEQNEHILLFNLFFEKICLGCLTGFSTEYIQVLQGSSFSLDYLNEHENTPGIHIFLESKTINDIDSIKIHLQSFALKYMFKGFLKHNQILNCISADIFECVKFIPDPNAYYSELLEKAVSITDLASVEMIAEFLRPVLNTKNLIYPVRHVEKFCESTLVNESDLFANEILTANPDSFETPNLYFLNAHTKTSELFNEQQISNTSYPALYFQVYKLRKDPRVVKNIQASQLSIESKIKLLLYLNNPDIIEQFSENLIGHGLNRSLETLILEKKNLTSSLIYFLCTGLVSISNSSFFVRCIKCCLKAKNEGKVHSIFKNYIKAVPQKAFDNFYSICYILKGCSVKNLPSEIILKSENNIDSILPGKTVYCDDSLIMNPMITETLEADQKVELKNAKSENITNTLKETTIILPNISIPTADPNIKNESPNDKIKLASEEFQKPIGDKSKLVLSFEDKMLHSICNYIVTLRPGEIVSLQFNPSKYGFYKLSDLQYEMIGHGQVKYE